jgi:hypothetical protein
VIPEDERTDDPDVSQRPTRTARNLVQPFQGMPAADPTRLRADVDGVVDQRLPGERIRPD